MIKLKRVGTEDVLYKSETASTIKEAVVKAVADGISLLGVDLYEADLSNVDLYKADLRQSDLRNTNLSGTNLNEARLAKANLCGADLSEANLYDTDVYIAILTKASHSLKLLTSLDNPYKVHNMIIGEYQIRFTLNIYIMGNKSFIIQEWKDYESMSTRILKWCKKLFLKIN